MDEFMKAMEEYEDRFGDSFPTFKFMSMPESEIIEIIEECLEKDADAYELGYAEDDDDIMI